MWLICVDQSEPVAHPYGTVLCLVVHSISGGASDASPAAERLTGGEAPGGEQPAAGPGDGKAMEVAVSYAVEVTRRCKLTVFL